MIQDKSIVSFLKINSWKYNIFLLRHRKNQDVEKKLLSLVWWQFSQHPSQNPLQGPNENVYFFLPPLKIPHAYLGLLLIRKIHIHYGEDQIETIHQLIDTTQKNSSKQEKSFCKNKIAISHITIVYKTKCSFPLTHILVQQFHVKLEQSIFEMTL